MNSLKLKDVNVEVPVLVDGDSWIICAEVSPHDDVNVRSIKPDEGTTGEPPSIISIEDNVIFMEAICEAAAEKFHEQVEKYEADLEYAAEMKADMQREEAALGRD